MKDDNLRKADFWESDCFVEKGLTGIWKLYPEDGRERESKK